MYCTVASRLYRKWPVTSVQTCSPALLRNVLKMDILNYDTHLIKTKNRSQTLQNPFLHDFCIELTCILRFSALLPAATEQWATHRPTFVKKMCDKLGFVKVSGTPPPPPPGGLRYEVKFWPKFFACGALFEVFLPVWPLDYAKISALRADSKINNG